MKKFFCVLVLSMIATSFLLPTGVFAQQPTSRIEVLVSKFSVEADTYYSPYISSGLICVKSGGKYGYLDLAENVVIPFKYKSASDFDGEYALVQGQDDKYYIIDKVGKEKPLMYEGKQIDINSYLQPSKVFNNGLTRLSPDEVWAPTCYVDINGKTVLPLSGTYDRHGFRNGYLLSGNGLYDNNAKLITTWKDGIEIDLGQDILHAFVSDGLIPFSIKDTSGKWKYGYVNLKGDTVIQPSYNAAHSFSGGYAVVQNDGKEFAINTKGKQVTPDFPLNTISSGLFAGRFVAENRLFDENGRLVYTCPEGITFSPNNSAYGSDYYSFNPVFIVRNRKTDKQGVVDKNGNVLLPCEYDSIHNFVNGYSTGVKDGKLLVFKLSDETVGQQVPDSIEYTSNALGFSITLPSSWQGKYRVYDCIYEGANYVSFIHKGLYLDSNIGTLFTIKRVDGKLTPDEAKIGAGQRRLLISTNKYSYVLAYPSDVQYTDEFEADYNKMSADIEEIGKSIKIVPITNESDPTYQTVTIFDENDIINDYIYYFKNGSKNSSSGTLLMIDGEFADADVLIENGSALVPSFIIQQELSCNVIIDSSKGSVKVYNDKINIEMAIGKTDATVNGENVSIDSYPIVVSNKVYLPIRFVAVTFGKAVGYFPTGTRGLPYGFAHNPVVWIDDAAKTEKAEKSKDEVLLWLRAQMEQGLNTLKANLGTVNKELLKEIKPNNPALATIEQLIKEALYVGQVGRYLVFIGPYTAVVDTDNNTIYFRTISNAMSSLRKADMGNPNTFVPMQFAD